MSSNHERIVQQFAKLPPRKYEPKPVWKFPPKQKTSNGKLRRFSQKMNGFLQSSVKDVVENTFAAVVRSVHGTEVLEDGIPVSKLSSRAATHFLLMLQQAERSGLNFRTWKTDTMTRFIDFGGGNVLEVGVQLHGPTVLETETKGSVIANMRDARDDQNFDLVPYEKGEVKIESAVMWRPEEERESTNKNTK